MTTVKELIEMLKEHEPEAPVWMATRGRHSAVSMHIYGPVRKRDVSNEWEEDCDGTVYILSDGDYGSLPVSLWD